MVESWSYGALSCVSSPDGESGKHDEPGKIAERSCGRECDCGSIVSSSAMMQPTDHTSMAAVYRCIRMSSCASESARRTGDGGRGRRGVRMTRWSGHAGTVRARRAAPDAARRGAARTGARYHRVTTCDVSWRVSRARRSGSAAGLGSTASGGLNTPPWFTTRDSPKSQILTSQLPLSSTFAGLRSRCSTCAEWMCSSAASVCRTIHWTCCSVIVCGDTMSLRMSRST